MRGMMIIRHEFYMNADGEWIVKSISGVRSLQTRWERRPTDEELKSDYALLDEKLMLAEMVASGKGYR